MIWTGEQHAACLRMWRDDKTAREIAAAVGKSADAVYMHIHHLRRAGFDLPLRARGYRKGHRKWQPEEVRA